MSDCDSYTEQLDSVHRRRIAADGFIVSVRAQAMMVDESTGLWRPIKGSSLSTVALHKQHGEFFIAASRSIDQQEVLRCCLRADIVYQAPNPTFHHWNTGSRRHGLTFVNLSDARKFECAVKGAIQELNSKDPAEEEEVFDSTEAVNVRMKPESSGEKIPQRPHKPRSLYEEKTENTRKKPRPLPVSDWLEEEPPPATPPRSSSSAGSMGPSGGSQGSSHSIIHQRQESVRETPSAQVETKCRDDIWVKHVPVMAETLRATAKQDEIAAATLSSYSVSSASYNGLDSTDKIRKEYSDYRKDYYVPCENKCLERPSPCRASTAGCEIVKDPRRVEKIYNDAPPLPTKKKKRRFCCIRKSRNSNPQLNERRQLCMWCDKWYSDDSNYPGACPSAPSHGQQVIGALTCKSCVDCTLSSCAREGEGQFEHTWTCDNEHVVDSRSHHCRRWSLVLCLGIVLPCIWCFVPLSACHQRGKSRNWWGPRHKPTKLTESTERHSSL